MKLLDVAEDSFCDSDKLVHNLNGIFYEVYDLVFNKSKSPKPFLKNKQAKLQRNMIGLMNH